MSWRTLFTSTGNIKGAGITTYRDHRTTTLANILTGHEEKKIVPLMPKFLKPLVSVRQVIQDIFADTRQQHQESLNSNDDISTDDIAEQIERQNLVVSTAGLGLATAGVFVSSLFYLPAIACALYAARTYTYEGYRLFVEERRVDYRTVLALSVPATLAIGAIWTASFGVAFFSISFYLVAKTENRSRQSVTRLFGDQIHTVWVLADGVETEVPIEQVAIGDIVVAHAGQMIPVDGVITEGAATIDQHMLTGEAQPAEKGIGDNVLAATMIVSGRLCICVEKSGDSTVVAQITDMLNQTTDFKQALESKTERYLNKATLPILGLSALALPLVGMSGAAAMLWYQPGLRMVLFGPLSMLSYLQIAAQKGILIKDGRALEVLNEVDTVVFDKTGTLTLGQPTVGHIFCYNGMSETNLLRFAAAAEAKQTHPIAHAILTAAQKQNLHLPEFDDAEYKMGYGLKVEIAEQTTRVGSIRFMEMEGLIISAEVAAQQVKSHAQGYSLVLVAIDDEVAGAIELRPTIRDEAKVIIEALQERGLETVIMSGDHDAPTRRLATELNIDRYYAEVLPEDKSDLVKQLQREGKKVCFVGDGINDSIALKTADTSISLRGATTMATDIAQIIFMDGTLAQLPTLFTKADDFTATMRTNWIATSLPCIIGIAGTLFFGWGVTACVLLLQASTPVGIYNGLKPLLDERRNQI